MTKLTFRELALPSELLTAVTEMGFTETTAKDCKVAGGKFELPKPAKPADKKA